MKKIQLTISCFAFLLASSVYATQCPATLSVSYGHFDPPANYAVTLNTVDTNNPTIIRNKNYPLTFSSAKYNWQYQVIPNGQKISCEYSSVDNYSIELTTVQGGFSAPSTTNTAWSLFTGDVYLCGGFLGKTPVNGPADCPWN